MTFTLKSALAALSLGAMVLSAAPAAADPPHRPNPGKHGNPGHGPNDWKHGGKHNGKQDRYQRPGRVIHNYDWDRPDPRYGKRYRADRYYRGGYEPIRVTRNTRIYRGYDDRYYCRRTDGTTGLIVGAALGGLLGTQLDRGGSNMASILIGGGAGALQGREIDRGRLSCR